MYFETRYIFDTICACRHVNLYHIAGERRATISQSNEVRLYCARETSISQGEIFMTEKTIKELSIDLIVEITAVCDSVKGRSVFTNQLLRSCSSIGANSHEAKYAQSRADFINKMEIALKECYETEYWLEVMFKVKSIDEATYKNLKSKCGTIRRKLIASVTTAKKRKEEKHEQRYDTQRA